MRQKKREMGTNRIENCDKDGERVMDRRRVRGSEVGHERLNRRQDRRETPLWGSTVTPAGRFTPSTK